MTTNLKVEDFGREPASIALALDHLTSRIVWSARVVGNKGVSLEGASMMDALAVIQDTFGVAFCEDIFGLYGFGCWLPIAKPGQREFGDAQRFIQDVLDLVRKLEDLTKEIYDREYVSPVKVLPPTEDGQPYRVIASDQTG